MIVYSENLAREIPWWYLKRSIGPWGALGLVLVATHIVVPFLILLGRAARRDHRGILRATALLLALSRLGHEFWLVLPEFPDTSLIWIAPSATLAVRQPRSSPCFSGSFHLLDDAETPPRRGAPPWLTSRALAISRTIYRRRSSPRYSLGWPFGGGTSAVIALALLFPGSVRQTQEASRHCFPSRNCRSRRQTISRGCAPMKIRILSSYGWVDRAHGVVRVPIDVAIRHLAAQGIPSWPAR